MNKKPLTEIIQHLQEKIAESMNVTPDKVDIAATFDSFGLDSLHQATIMGDLEKWLDIKLNETIFYDYPTIQTLAEYLNGEVVSKEDSTMGTSGENFDLDALTGKQKVANLKERIHQFFIDLPPSTNDTKNYLMREVLSAADREVVILDPITQQPKKMLMFGSNNYLGLANHPHVLTKVKASLEKYGAGIGGPPLLNGYLGLTKELEERLAALKHAEAAVVFPNGYGTNLGLIDALTTSEDAIIFDEYSHASFVDGLKFSSAKAIVFAHNDMAQLEMLLKKYQHDYANIFVGVEGVYSMDGDLAPLDKIAPLCKKYSATLIIDDAHGTGVMGEHGGGTAEHFHVEKEIDVSMGTFSKAFAVVGGFVAANKELTDYLRFYARSYMFSAALPPTVLATVLAGLDVIANEPWRRKQLRENVAYAAKKIRNLGINVAPQAGILALITPPNLDMSKARRVFHQSGIFVNSVEFPAVPKDKQRFRISMMATHTQEDIDRLVNAIAAAWQI